MVQVGSNEVKGPPGEYTDIQKVAVHPKYIRLPKDYKNDLVVMILSKKIK